MIEQLYTEFHTQLLKRCAALCRDGGAAEDLVQETFLRALTHLGDLQDLSREQRRAWLYKTARRLYIDHIRRAAREAAADPADLESAAFQEDFSAPAVGQLVGRLPPEERAIFTLRYFEGYNATELGEIFSLPPATVRSRLAAARRRLAGWLTEESGGWAAATQEMTGGNHYGAYPSPQNADGQRRRVRRPAGEGEHPGRL